MTSNGYDETSPLHVKHVYGIVFPVENHSRCTTELLVSSSLCWSTPKVSLCRLEIASLPSTFPRFSLFSFVPDFIFSCLRLIFYLSISVYALDSVCSSECNVMTQRIPHFIHRVSLRFMSFVLWGHSFVFRLTEIDPMLLLLFGIFFSSFRSVFFLSFPFSFFRFSDCPSVLFENKLQSGWCYGLLTLQCHLLIESAVDIWR